MITDSIENADKYSALHPEFARIFDLLKSFSSSSEARRYDIDGENVFVSLTEYENKSREECSFEAHKKYADIQYVVSGHEQIDVCSVSGLSAVQDFEDGGDIAFYSNPESYSTADLHAGEFAVIFPCEAHRPLVSPYGAPVKMKKAVAKIKMAD